MKNFIYGLVLLFALNAAYADSSMTNVSTSKWLCTTNASSASTDADKQADDAMSKNAQAANASFAFALQHCRDCTKITCSVQQ